MIVFRRPYPQPGMPIYQGTTDFYEGQIVQLSDAEEKQFVDTYFAEYYKNENDYYQPYDMVSDRAGRVTGVIGPNGLTSTFSEFVSVKDFGAVGDGVTDDTAAIRAAHEAANATGRRVTYFGCTKVAIQANAQIPVNTTVDFEGCELIPLDGFNATPSFNTINKMFVVADPETPLQSGTFSIAATNLQKGSHTPTLGAFDGHGYAMVSAPLLIPNRAKTGTQNYKQSFKVNRRGRSSHSLAVDLQAHAESITIQYRKTSSSRISLCNVKLVESSSWNNQSIFYIQRCNVEVSNLTFLVGTTEVGTNICKIIWVEDASDLMISDVVTTGRPAPTNAASYVLNMDRVADVVVERMNAITGWGATGNNDMSGVTFRDCVLNRVDSHDGAFNIFVHNCHFHNIGMVYGWGGGIVKVSDSTMHNCAAISTRSDYGGTFFGDLVVHNCTFDSNNSAAIFAIDLQSNPMGASTEVFAPTTIAASNLTRVGKSTSASGEFSQLLCGF